MTPGWIHLHIAYDPFPLCTGAEEDWLGGTPAGGGGGTGRWRRRLRNLRSDQLHKALWAGKVSCRLGWAQGLFSALHCCEGQGYCGLAVWKPKAPALPCPAVQPCPSFTWRRRPGRCEVVRLGSALPSLPLPLSTWSLRGTTSALESLSPTSPPASLPPPISQGILAGQLGPAAVSWARGEL